MKNVSKVVQLFGRVSDKEEKHSDMDVNAFRTDLVRPALKVTDMWSMAAENLIVGTALTESDLSFVVQIKGGGALSFMQVEKATYIDCIRYLSRSDKKNIKQSILSACFMEIFPQHESLTWNIRLAILIARIKYWMIPERLPRHDDAAGLCNYYLQYYNTAKGKNTFERAVSHFIKACEK